MSEQYSRAEQYSRTVRLIGQDALDRLRGCRVAVFGLGGVGGYAVEALARSGVGALDLIDSDAVAVSNLNRQLIATRSNIGQLKVDAFAQRIQDIDPSITVRKYPVFYLPEKREEIPFEKFDYIVDAIDTVSAKLDIVETATKLGVPVICAMGCGNRLDPGRLKVCDINKTEGDPLAKAMRRQLRERGIKKLKVVWSAELPVKPAAEEPKQAADHENAGNTVPGRHAPSSMVFVPAAAGLMLAAEVVKDLIGKQQNQSSQL